MEILESGTVDHGGSLDRARALFPDARQPFVDLSTGINPHSYPLFDLPATALTRLPEPEHARELAGAAASAYGAPSASAVVAAPGTQLLLPLVASLMEPGRAAVLGPTYAEHARAAAIAGHDVREVRSFSELEGSDLAIIVNPNNPDGRMIERAQLLEFSKRLRGHNGLLIVDEAFMDVTDGTQSLAGDADRGGIVVLRSFGKFFGLAGVRLGFAICDAEIAQILSARLGPWAVSGPALEYGLRGLNDRIWQAEMRLRLGQDARRLDAFFAGAGISVTGGTSLFRYIESDDAAQLFNALGAQGILLRHFQDRPNALRCGLPGTEEDWSRVEAALSNWREAPFRGKVAG